MNQTLRQRSALRVLCRRSRYVRIAEMAEASAVDAERDLDIDEAAVCREIEADARGLALGAPLVETPGFLTAGAIVALAILLGCAEGVL